MRDIIIDCRVFQTAAWHRGMGRYLLSLLEQLEKLNPSKLTLVFSANLDFQEHRREALQKIAPSAKLTTLPFPNGLSAEHERQCTRIFDEWVGSNELNNPVFVSGSIFSFDYQPFLSSRVTNTLIFYDLIPLKRWYEFFDYFPEAEYSRRFKYVYEADHIFAISEEVEDDLQTYLSINPNRITNIKGASIPDLEPVKKRSYAKLKGLGSRDRFIMLPGGDSPHKNMLRAIAAFDKMNASFGDTFKLVITSSYSDKNQEIMQALSPNVVLTGEVSDEELKMYYKEATVMMFASLDEGLGLPLLETVDFGGVVACSDIPVFKEITNDAFYFFNPQSVDSIADTLLAAIIDEKAGSRENQYKKIRQQFSWQNSAKILVGSLDTITPIQSSPKHSGVVIEQTHSDSENALIGSMIAKYGTSNTSLYLDQIALIEKTNQSVPLLATHFLQTKDIVDLKPPKSRKSPERLLYVLTDNTTELTELTAEKSPGYAMNLHSHQKPKPIKLTGSMFIKSVDEIND